MSASEGGVRTWADRYVELGWAVLPIQRDDKEPVYDLAPHAVKSATQDLARIAEWWSSGSTRAGLNIGGTPPADQVIVDVDGPEGLVELKATDRELPSTATQKTIREGGLHLVYTLPPPPEGFEYRQKDPIPGKINTRLHGRGYVVLEPSSRNGSSYHWAVPPRPENITEAPVWLVELLLEPVNENGDREPVEPTGETEIPEDLIAKLQDGRTAAGKLWAGKKAKGDTSGSGMDASLAGTLGAMGFDDAAVEAALRAFPHGQVSRTGDGRQLGRLLGIAAEARAARIEEQLDGETPSSSLRPEIAAEPTNLDTCHAVFRRWLGDSYELDAVDAVLCTLAAERLEGDPLWLLMISGPGNAKTETVIASGGAGAVVTSTLSSEAALLSGSPKREKGKDATGGLLRKIGDSGVLVIKDVTSILTMDRNLRGAMLAALREVHDGFWERNLGVDGGRTLTWRGRIAVIGAVTTAWDRAHAVISSMGDRFVLLRTDSTRERVTAGRRAIANTGDEERMRAELSEAVGGVIAGMDTGADLELSEAETDQLLAAANLVTLARTGVDYDYRGDVIDSHAPEMPTRFAKQLAQVVRGGLAIGMDRERAMRLAIRCARDSMPPLRLAILEDVAEHPDSTTHAARKRLQKPRATVDRQLQALHLLGVLVCDEREQQNGKTAWHYSLAEEIDPAVLVVPDLFVSTLSPIEEKELESLGGLSNKSGTTLQPEDCGRCGRDSCIGDCEVES